MVAVLVVGVCALGAALRSASAPSGVAAPTTPLALVRGTISQRDLRARSKIKGRILAPSFLAAGVHVYHRGHHFSVVKANITQSLLGVGDRRGDSTQPHAGLRAAIVAEVSA